MNTTNADWRTKWQCLKDNAKRKGVSFALSFDEYISLAQEAGVNHPDMIGKGVDKYQMGRLGDSGGYELGNCRFITMRQNLDERRINGGNQKISEKMIGCSGNGEQKRGRTKQTHDGVLSQSLKISKSFLLTSPMGVTHSGVNLSEFCRVNNLNQGLMSAVCRGQRTSHKGWTGEYVYE